MLLDFFASGVIGCYAHEKKEKEQGGSGSPKPEKKSKKMHKNKNLNEKNIKETWNMR